jgi:hypothetical protein
MAGLAGGPIPPRHKRHARVLPPSGKPRSCAASGDAGAGGVSLSFPCIMQFASCYWSVLSKP